MSAYQYTVVIEPDDGGYHAYVPALPGCHTFGDTLDEVRANIVEAITLHIQCLVEDGEVVPLEAEPILITRLSVPGSRSSGSRAATCTSAALPTAGV